MFRVTTKGFNQIKKATIGSATSKPKEEQPEQEVPDKTIMTSFLSFEDDCIVLLKYLQEKPQRDYGMFRVDGLEEAKQLPTITWDSRVLFC